MMPRNVEIELHPFGKQKIEIRGAVAAGTPEGNLLLVYAQVLHNPFVPLVRTNSADARAFAQAILETCDALDSAAVGLVK